MEVRLILAAALIQGHLNWNEELFFAIPLRVQEAGYYPPQETGLTYNSWFGKPHLEMHWWHAAHFALWGRPELLEKSLSWYEKVADKAKAIAQATGI